MNFWAAQATSGSMCKTPSLGLKLGKCVTYTPTIPLNTSQLGLLIVFARRIWDGFSGTEGV